MPQDAIKKLFGRPTFTGSGDVADYFPGERDLSYLAGQRPEFIEETGNYDPSLDVENLVRQGVSVPKAMELQELRARAHQGAAQNRVAQDARGAMEALKQIDYSSPNLPNQLVQIFSQFPNARKSKEVIESVNFFRGLKPQSEVLDIETIADPITYNKAKAEGWDKLPKSQAMRKIAGEEHNRKILALAIENGLSPDDLADTFDKDAGIYDQFRAEHKIKAGRYNPAEETDPRLAYRAISEGWDKLSKNDAARKRAAALLNIGIEDDAEAMGLDATELEPFMDKNTGVYDLGKVKGHLRQYASKLKTYPTAEIAKYTARAQEERDALLSDEGKLEYLQQKYNDPKKKDFSKQDWDEAYQVLSTKKTPSEEALESIQSAMGGKPKAKTSQSTETPSATPVDAGYQKVDSQQAYDALPSGAKYIDSNGKKATKK